MKGLLGLLRHKIKPELAQEKGDSQLFKSAFAESVTNANPLVTWPARALELGAASTSPEHGTELMQGLWARDKYMSQLDQEAIGRMARFFDFATVGPKRDVIRQDEYGNYMVVLLSGGISINRIQPWGACLRLAEVLPGEILGEMSMLDNGIRFSSCSTTSECEIAILNAQAIDAMLNAEPALAAKLIILLARKLSLRMRVVSARLSDIK